MATSSRPWVRSSCEDFRGEPFIHEPLTRTEKLWVYGSILVAVAIDAVLLWAVL